MAVRVPSKDHAPEPPPRHVLRLAAPAAPLWKRTACVAARPLLLPVSSLAAVRTSEALVGLTFDDGPDPATTPAVLRGLARHDAKATFFMLSDRVRSYPEVARRVRDEGHEIALHGDDHTKMPSLPPGEVEARVARSLQVLHDVLEVPVRYFRFPGGGQRRSDVLAVRRLGLDVVVWSVSARDWRPLDVEQTAQGTATTTARGDILLLHDAFEAGARPDPVAAQREQIVDVLLTRLEDRGLRAVPVGQLCEGAQQVRVPWLTDPMLNRWRARRGATIPLTSFRRV